MKKTYMGKIWKNKKSSFAFKIIHTSNLYSLPEEKEMGNTYIIAFAWGFRIFELWFAKKGKLKDLV